MWCGYLRGLVGWVYRLVLRRIVDLLVAAVVFSGPVFFCGVWLGVFVILWGWLCVCGLLIRGLVCVLEFCRWCVCCNVIVVC